MRKTQLLKFDGGYTTKECYEILDFPWKNLDIRYSTSNKKIDYVNSFMAFDIETTTISNTENPHGFMYIWQACIQDILIYGRTWKEFERFLSDLVNYYHLSYNKRFIIYVHNLGFEFQFMRSFLARTLGDCKIFASQSRKPIYVLYECGIEFRCSWKLSNMSLEKACQNEKGLIHCKAMGDLDYKIIRTTKTYLDVVEFGYCMSDVQCLYEFILNRLRNEEDTLFSIPYTSTGYVRRYCRNQMKIYNPHYFIDMNKARMSKIVYELLLEAARGGDTHASRFFSGRIVSNVDSFDVVSSYPAQMLMQDYPIRKFMYYGDVDSQSELETIINGHVPCLFRCVFENIRLREYVAMPYIPLAKCKYKLNYINDNGRILKADAITITLTDIDYQIIREQYVWDNITIAGMHVSQYGKLPLGLRKAVLSLFIEKCELKEKISAKKKAKEFDSDYDNLVYQYNKCKNRLNGIFGMAYTKPVHSEIILTDQGTWKEESNEDIVTALNKYYRNRNNFLQYYWGVWTTAHARKWLFDLIELTGQSTTIYCDTDSSKAIDVDLKIIEQRNNEIKKLAEKEGAYCEVNGHKYYLGLYEHETSDKAYEKFITLGAKKYAYYDNELHTTISGVNKKEGAKELKTIENFKIGFVFNKAGGLELKYNDDLEIKTIIINGVEMETSSNIAMLDSTYTLGITDEYAEIIGYNIYENI